MSKIFSPEYLFEELNESRNEIIRKSKIDQIDFENFCQVIRRIAHVIPKKAYADYMVNAELVIEDVDDWPFAAAAISLGECGIWSNDAHFTEKATELFESFHIAVWTTGKLCNFMNNKG